MGQLLEGRGKCFPVPIEMLGHLPYRINACGCEFSGLSRWSLVRLAFGLLERGIWRAFGLSGIVESQRLLSGPRSSLVRAACGFLEGGN